MTIKPEISSGTHIKCRDEKLQRYDELVKAHNSWLHRYACRLCDEKSTAEDLVQETFLRAWRFLDSLKDEASSRSWLTTILRRENARRFERKQLDYADVEMDSLPTTQSDVDARPEVVALRIAMQRLPIACRELLTLQVLEGYTLADIARIKGLPRTTVATRLHSARQKLKLQLQAGEGISSKMCDI